MRIYISQCFNLFYIRVLLKIRNPLLLFFTVFMCAILALIFPQDKLARNSGSLTLIYSFWAWVCVATYSLIHQKQNRFKHNLLYNGVSIAIYKFTLILVEALQCVVICGLGLILNFLDKHYEYPFYFGLISYFELFYSELAYGMIFLSQAVLIAQFIDDEYSSVMIALFCQCFHFLIFPTRDITVDHSSADIYFYFGSNALIPGVSNFLIAIGLSTIFYTAYSIVNYMKYSRNRLVYHVKKPRPQIQQDRSFIIQELDSIQNEGILKIIDLSKSFGNSKALQNISVRMFTNEITCIVGKNGSGKTTLMNIISRYLKPTAGKVIFQRTQLKSEPTIGYCPQENNLPGLLTLSEIFNVYFSLRDNRSGNIDRESHKRILFRQIGLSHHLNTQYKKLSIGMKRKFALLLSLVNEPDFILLDEPVSSLDQEFQQQFWKTLGRLKPGRMIIVVTHDMNAASVYADHCIVLHEGRLICNISLEELKTRARSYLKIQARVNADFPSLSQFRMSQIEKTVERTEMFQEYRVLRTETGILSSIISQHLDDTLIISSVTIEDEIMEIIREMGEGLEKNYSDTKQNFLRREISKFEADHIPKWGVQFSILFKRRLGIIFFKPRNIVSLFLIFLLIVIEALSMKLKLANFPYRALISLVVFISEEAIQRTNKYKQLVYISGISIFQYNLAILLADMVVFTLLYFGAFCGFLAGTAWHQDFIFDFKVIGVFIVGSFANLSFTYVVCLFTDQPLLLQGIYQIFITYFSYYIFSQTYLIAFLFPNILSSYLISIFTDRTSRATTQPRFINIGEQGLTLILLLQFVVYFILLLCLDYFLNNKLKTMNTRSFDILAKEVVPIDVSMQNKKLKINYKFMCSKGKILGIFGPPQTGKTDIINLLLKQVKNPAQKYKGHCEVLGGDILSNQTVISNNLCFCMENDHFQEGFTLFNHLYLLAKLKGLSNKDTYKQIFYIGKLLDLESHFFKKIQTLSGGTKRKASISATLIGGPNLILIDEPTKNLDPIVAKNLLLAMQFFVKKLNRSMVYTSKKKEELFLVADSVLELQKADEHDLNQMMESLNRKIRVKILYSNTISKDKDKTIESSYTLSPGSDKLHLLLESSSYSAHQEVLAHTFTSSTIKQELVDFLQNLRRMGCKIEEIYMED